MPAPTVFTAPERADLRSRLLGAQFWVGIALAPIAVLLLLFGGTAAAAVLAIIAVVVLALSVMLRSDPSVTRATGATADEMNVLREDVRADITTAARATHRALSEKMMRLEESVAGVQRLAESFAGIRRLEDAIAGVQSQVEAARAVAIEARAAVDNQRELPLPPPHRPATVVGSVPGVVRHTETVVTRSMYVDQPAEDLEPRPVSGSTVYGSASRSAAGRAAIGGVVNGSATYGSTSRRRDVATDHDSDDDGSHGAGRHTTGRHDTGRRHEADRDDAGRHDAGRHDAGRDGARWIDHDAPSPPESRERGPRRGSARRDEPRGAEQGQDEPRAGSPRRGEPRRGEPRASEQRWDATADEPWRRELPSGHDDHDDAADRDGLHESWTEQRLRAYLPQLRESLGYRSGGVRDRLDSSADLANDSRWAQMRDGDRWAEVRSDDRGRELRMAERHAERHVDETGTQLRIVDRWSSVREERFPAASDHSPAPETRAQRRRRAEHDDRDGRDEAYPAAVTRAELPRPRHAPDEIRSDRSSGEVARGWRDVRSGVIEPDHSDGYEASRYDGPSQDRPSRDAPSHGWRSHDSVSHDSVLPDSVLPDWASHDDVGIYRRRSADRPAAGSAAPPDAYEDPYRGGWADDGTAACRDSRDVPPASPWDGGDVPPTRRAEPAAYDERDDRDDRWVREPGRRSSGRRPQLHFEVNDDRWN